MSLAVVPQLPDWMPDLLRGREPTIDPEAQMTLAIDLALANVDQGTGGPFGAAIFDHRGRLVAAGLSPDTAVAVVENAGRADSRLFSQVFCSAADVSP